MELTLSENREIFYSENLEMSFITGSFNCDNGEYCFAGYDGQEWQVITNNALINTVVDYQDGVLVGAQFGDFDTGSNHYIAFYDGTQWSFPWQLYGSVDRLVYLNDTLYALGEDLGIDEDGLFHVAKLIDGEWQGVLYDSDISNFILFFDFRDIEQFQGDLYLAGDYIHSGPSSYLSTIDNGMLQEVGTGINGTWNIIRNLLIYESELYLSGCFPKLWGHAGNHIMRWNGVEYNSVNGPFLGEFGELIYPCEEGEILTMIEFGGHLYASGNFFSIGNTNISGLARWDGQKWCGLYGEQFKKPIEALGHYDESPMIVASLQEDIDPGNDNRVWIYNGGNEYSECTELSSLERSVRISPNLYPNPASNLLHVDAMMTINSVSIFSGTGRRLRRKENLNNNHRLDIDISNYSPGLYFIQMESTTGQVFSRKFVIR